MIEVKLPFRQVHLDFHTSGDIPEVCKDFDPEEFAYTLKKAHVNSVTCFAKCHHGYLYYNSRQFPERIHPTLVKKDLLKDQIEACHKYGIRVPIYISVQWDHYTAREHPEWLARNEEGAVIRSGDDIQKTFEAGFYYALCVNSPYKDLLVTQIKEILEMFNPVDGLFFDIVIPIPCACKWCINDMKKEGFKPHVKKERIAFAYKMIARFKEEVSDLVRKYNKNCSIFYNRGHIGFYERETEKSYTHFEIESLPSGGWGYLHFPISARYARTIKDEIVGQTARFHTSWGDFHSYKNKEALEFECYRMLANGGKCIIGDQLHPSGRLDKEAYTLIEEIYAEVEKKEEWCEEARPITEIGVLNPEEFQDKTSRGSLPKELQGATRILEEGAYQFDIIDSSADFNKYRLLILPDSIPIDENLKEKIKAYLTHGGSIIATFESGLNKEKDKVMLEELGIELRENPITDLEGNIVRGRFFPRADYADYLIPRESMRRNLSDTEYVMYIKGTEIKIKDGTEVLADTVLPYFYRNYEHFCSHKQAPSAGKIDCPAITKNGNTVYFVHPIFTIYYYYAPKWCKELMFNAIDMLIKEKLVIHNGPTSLIVTLNKQEKKKRYILHLLHYIPVKKAREIDIVEDTIPIYHLKTSVLLKENIKEVEMVPERQKIKFEIINGRINFVVPEVRGHQMISISYE